VVKAVMRQEITHAGLGGAAIHRTQSGVAHFTASGEENLFAQVRALLSFLPSNNLTPPPLMVTNLDDPTRLTPELERMASLDAQQPYDVLEAIQVVVDNAEFLEVQPDFAPNLVVGFARLGGRPVGMIANQPFHLAGALDIDASDKGARFIRFCDAFHIPLVTFIDTPGFLPGLEQEQGGIIRHGAKLLYAYAEASVPKLSVVVRKAIGGAYIVMSSKHLGGDLNLAYPGAEIAVMGAEGAVNVVFRREIEAAADQEARRSELIRQYTTELANPFVAASHGYIDDIIQPAETRRCLIQGLEALNDKRLPASPRKHGNIPL
jgi:acetyl-CoA carboxylase carboxyltransferase component